MKKLASLVLALIMVFSVAGTAACAENAPVEIEFFTNRSFEGAAATDLEKDNFVEQYLRENLGVDIRYVYTDELTTNLNLRLFSGDVPDVFNVENRNYLKQYADEGYLLNLDEHADKLADAFAFTEGNASAGKIDGATYAIPGRPYGFREAYWYNVNAFKKAGVTEMPTTLTGLVDAVREASASPFSTRFLLFARSLRMPQNGCAAMLISATHAKIAPICAESKPQSI